MKLEQLVRSSVRRMRPYSSARSEFSGAAEVFLDANENAYGSAAGEQLNRYPDPLCSTLRQNLAARLDLTVDQIVIGNGSDEIIGLLVLAFCEPGIDTVAITPPTFGMYEVAAAMNAIEVVRVPLTAGFSVPSAQLISQAKDAKLIFLCSPNNPTGATIPRDVVCEIASSVSGLVVVDEAYIDYAPEHSVIDCLRQYPNVFILRTFSKAYGMAAARIGIGLGSPEVIQYLLRIKPPYNVNAISQQLAVKALENQQFLDAISAETRKERSRLLTELSALDAVEHVFPSAANFLLVRFRDANAAFEKLRAAGIIVRNRSSVPGCEQCLRITVGTPGENSRLLAVLGEEG